MNQLNKYGVLVVGMAGLWLGVNGEVAQAQTTTSYLHTTKTAKWHKGTPKALRGKYRTKHYDADLMSIYKVHAKSTWYWASGMPIVRGKNVHYQSLGHHHYVLREDEPANGGFRGAKHVKIRLTKVGHNLKFQGSTRIFYKY